MSRSKTTEKILDVAEELFATQGFHTTTLRQITRAAGVNLAAVNYHLGSKQALIHAVFERYLDELNKDRLARLEVAGTAPADQRLERVLEALIEPALQLGGRGDQKFTRLLVRAFAENDRTLHDFARDRYAHVMRRFAASITDTLQTVYRLDPCQTELRDQLDFIVGALTFSMAYEARDKHPETVSASLVRFAAAGLVGLEQSGRLATSLMEA